MRVLIIGASGVVGTALTTYLRRRGHEVEGLGRGPKSQGPLVWDPARGELDPAVFSGFDAVVHLSGANIGEGRWTRARRRELWNSRIDSTRLLVERMKEAENGPRTLVCASAIGLYGDRGDEVLTEASPRGKGFLADLVEAWETEAARAAEAGLRVVSTRFGVVMAPQDGALRRLALLFNLGAGGRLGSGRQWMSWIAPADLVRAVEWVLEHDIAGPVNVVAPQPATNLEVTRALSRVLHRPALFPVPAFALRLVVGQSADELLLASQRVVPSRLAEAGFEFTLPEIEAALRAVLKPGSSSSSVSTPKAA